ncbi:MAG: accessory gene regulator B family protein [Oscillospiraceae bacterium]|nr:accessory gene regulator B family protein [Oscillospiraceae bacterium]
MPFVLLITIIPLQAYGGGYHAKTHFRCFLIRSSGGKYDTCNT